MNNPLLLTSDQQQRYSRQLALSEVSAAGVGTIGVIDHDVVDLSNLQRQILHTTKRIGMGKTKSARLALNVQNPDVAVIEHLEALTPENARTIFSGYDVILNGSDNFATRYLEPPRV